MGDTERLAFVRLSRTDGIGPVTFLGLINRFGTAQAACENLPDYAASRGRRELRLPTPGMIEREFERTARHGARFCLSSDDDYPTGLAALDAPPPVLTVMGSMALANAPCVAMVGARNASAPARKIATDMAAALAAEGYTIVSGLARGLDTAAHEGAGPGATIAVIAGGIDNVYPPQNRELQARIADEGLLISESTFASEPKARDFPRRNRLVTGLSLGVVVVEAAQRSGSLISARCALEQGREVMAVPGSPLDPRTKGSNGLIRSGALLVETADDVLDALRNMTRSGFRSDSTPLLFETASDVRPAG